MVILVSLRLWKRQRKKQSFHGRSFAGLRLLKERVGQQLRSHSFILHLRLTAPLLCGVPRAALDLRFEDPISN
jgi:hypothetical protein